MEASDRGACPHRRTAPALAMVLIVVLLLVAVPAGATPYQINYEGDVFPENAGWRRDTSGGPGAARTVQDGLLILCSEDIDVTDGYFWDQADTMDPAEGEVFFVEWRILVNEVSNLDLWDPGVTIASNAWTDASFLHGYDRVLRAHTFDSYVIATGVFHTYRFESSNMLDFTLTVDGALALTGEMEDSLNHDYVAFGDAVGGVASTSSWDYIRFGVAPVPEPASTSGWLLLAAALVWRRRRVRWVSSAHS